MNRDDRAKHIREARKRNRELRAEVERDQFLQEWLAESEASERAFAKESFTKEELAGMADRMGFRSARAWHAAREDWLRLLRNFVHAEPFKQLWALLKCQQQADNYIWGYSPAHAGVPSRLLQAMDTWHKAPKFTATERRAHSRKIAKACQLLEDLLGQVEPSDPLDGQYSRFRFGDEGQAKAIFRPFGVSSTALDGKPYIGMEWAASQHLANCGVVPIWAVRNIRSMALEGKPSTNPLPAKVRAKTAKKTFFIGAILEAIRSSSVYSEKDIKVRPQLVADIVELIAGMDCTADDVRKAMPRRPDGTLSA